jgi:putative protein-disulfide isomerase
MNKPKILYIQDAMCTWCYAFGGVLDDIKVKYGNDFDFVAYSAGMVVGESIVEIGKMQTLFDEAIPKVEKYSGVKFGDKFHDLVKEGTFMCNSIKPAIALSAFKSIKPEGSVEFAHDIQFEYFYNGKNINERDVYVDLANHHGVDANDLLQRMNDEEFHKLTMNEFEQVKKMGIKEYPVVLGQTEKGIYALSKGYIPEKEMNQIFELFKKTVEQEVTQL